MTELTICMNVYNGAEYLQKSIGSIQKQTLQDFEILVYDDGSTDNTVSVLEAFNDQRIRIVRGGENRGVLYARSTMIPMINTEYSMWLDADDYFCRDDALEYALGVAKAENYDLVNILPIQLVDKDGNVKTDKYGRYKNFSYFGDDFFVDYYPVGRSTRLHSKVIKTELLKKSVPDAETYSKRYAGDEQFFGAMWYFQLKRYCHLRYCEPIYAYNYQIGVWGSKMEDRSLGRIDEYCRYRHDAMISMYERMSAIRPLTEREVRNLVAGFGLDKSCDWIKVLKLTGKLAEHSQACDIYHKWFGMDGVHLLNGYDDKAFELPNFVHKCDLILNCMG